jgi:hypothetical protein
VRAGAAGIEGLLPPPTSALPPKTSALPPQTSAVRLAKAGDRTIGQVAKDLDLTETALRDWVRRAEVDAGKGPADALTSRNGRSWCDCAVRTSDWRWSAKS